MPTVALHLRPHCAKFLQKYIESDIACNRKKMLSKVIFSMLERKPMSVKPVYKYSKSLDYPVRGRWIKKGVFPKRDMIYIPPNEMKLLDGAIDDLFRLELMLATKWVVMEEDLRFSIQLFLNSYNITEEEFSLETAIKWEQRNRDRVDPYRIKEHSKCVQE